MVIGDDCIIFGGTLTLQQPQDTPNCQAERLSRVYFNDLLYLRFSGDEANSGGWVHQPKRAGELWPSARSGHAAAAGDA